MALRTRLGTLAPRMLLLFGVLACLFCLGQVGRADHHVSMASPGVAMTADHAAHGGAAGDHSGHGEDGHAGHCLSSAPTPSVDAVAIAGDAGLLSAAPADVAAHMPSSVLAVPYPRPPDLAALCVQRT